ncbi:hypothetical protein GCM10017752_54610 [Streptomyces roseoviridis]
MPPPPDETSPRRRPLGRGPGTSPSPAPPAAETGERQQEEPVRASSAPRATEAGCGGDQEAPGAAGVETVAPKSAGGRVGDPETGEALGVAGVEAVARKSAGGRVGDPETGEAPGVAGVEAVAPTAARRRAGDLREPEQGSGEAGQAGGTEGTRVRDVLETAGGPDTAVGPGTPEGLEGPVDGLVAPEPPQTAPGRPVPPPTAPGRPVPPPLDGAASPGDGASESGPVPSDAVPPLDGAAGPGGGASESGPVPSDAMQPVDGAAGPGGGASESGPVPSDTVPPLDVAGTPPGPGAAAPAPAPAGRAAGEASAADGPADARDGRFTVRLANFEGPFDLLLQLISKHKMDVTEVALSKVTDEFMAHLRAMGPDGDLDQTTEFLVVAATLLDLKAARLLPAAEVEDEADLALLEARDLLFARLLQYRAYKRIAEILGERWEAEGRRHPRTVGLEPHHAELLPEVVISIGAEGFAKLAVKAMQPRAKPQVYVDHIHAPLVSVREQAAVVVALLRERGTLGFRELVEGADDTLTVVARFLALLELYREKAVALDQETPLGDLTVSWTGGETDAAADAVSDEFDQEPRTPEEDAP